MFSEFESRSSRGIDFGSCCPRQADASLSRFAGAASATGCAVEDHPHLHLTSFALQIDQLKQNAVAASSDFASQVRLLDTENMQLKRQILQLQQQHGQQTLQSATSSEPRSSSDVQQQRDVMKSLELAHAEQQKLGAAAFAAQSECARLQHQVASATSMNAVMQDTVTRHERKIEQQQHEIHELQSHVEDLRAQAARATACATAAEAEIVGVSAAAIASAAAADNEREHQQQFMPVTQQ